MREQTPKQTQKQNGLNKHDETHQDTQQKQHKNNTNTKTQPAAPTHKTKRM